jgi:F-type H+-transporting ATPase subunit delta
MKISRVSRKYAKAVFGALGDTATVREAHGQLVEVEKVLAAEPLLQKMLSHPHMRPDAKAELVDKLFGKQVTPQVLRLLTLLAKRGRFTHLSGIVTVLDLMLLDAEGIARAHVTSAIPLDDGQKKMVHERIGQLTHRKIELSTDVDPKLIGGLVIRVGDRLIDGSVRYHLEQLRDGLKAARIG